MDGDNATNDEVYEIGNAGQLYWFADKVNNENATYGSANAVLTANITVNSGVLDASGDLNTGAFRSWTPIGWYDNANSVDYYYSGTFDGNDNTISGLYYNGTISASDYDFYSVGFFGRNAGTIKDVGVENSYFELKYSGSFCYLGGVCGYNCAYNGSPKIESCSNAGRVSGTNNVGGVIGYNVDSGGKLNNCYYLEGCNADGTTFTSTEGTSKTAYEFGNGSVCYLLNGERSEGTAESPLAWYQNIDNGTLDTSPLLDSNGHGTVYASAPCPIKFSNTSGQLVEHIFEPDGTGSKKHICATCGLSEEHHSAYAINSQTTGTSSIKVTCGDCGEDLGTVTLSAPTGDLTYDGNTKTASVTKNVTGVAISAPGITYSKAGDAAFSGTPKDAGTYTASITLGTATVSVTYTIEKEGSSVKTVPSAKENLTYDGNAKELVAVGSDVTGGTLQYSTSRNGEYTTTIPTGTGAEQTQSIASVIVGTMILGAGDYTVSGNKGTNADNYTLTVSGTGNFTGTTTYAVGAVSNSNGVLSSDPTSGDISEGKLTLHVASVATKDLSATVKITFTNANYEISEAALTIQTTDKIPVILSGVTCGSRVYNGTAYAYTGTPAWKTEKGEAAAGKTTVTYYKAGEPSALAETPVNTGSYLAVFAIESTDYVGTESYRFEITKAVITVAAKNRSSYVGDAVPDLTTPMAGTDYIVTGLCENDVLSGTAIMSYAQEPDNTKAGIYEILIRGLTVPEGDNYYTITFTNGTLTIITKPSGGSSDNPGSEGGSGGSSGGSTGGGSSFGGGNSSGSGSTSGVTTVRDSGSNAATTTSPTEVKVENGTASATVKAENVTEAIRQAADNKSAQIVFNVSEKDTGNADRIQLTTTKADVKQILDKTSADLVAATTAPKKGTLLMDSKTQMVYKVTKSGADGGTVQFVKTKDTQAKTVAIPDKVTLDGITYKVISIAAGALKNNKAVTTVTIPSKVKKIGNYAFGGLSSLKTIRIKTKLLTTKTVSEYAFFGISASTVIKVPKRRLKTYKTLFVKKGLDKKVLIKKW